MTKENFIEFIKELGFTQTWLEKPDFFSIKTDLENNYLNISIADNLDIFQLQETRMWSNMQSGKNFGNFSLKTFGDEGDFQLELFLSFIKGSFNKVPDVITQYMRDKKIKDILQ
jgi:hypothetical protein